ncbi:MAG TPA: carboxypeptidase regulatory-like domain-containing protein [Candidatus Polarisedimenticolia bacterium]|jgi:hypothetical protein
MRRLAAGVIALALIGGLARAQSTTATLKGTIRTADGTPVAGAAVTARCADIGVAREATTDAQGRYRIDLLPSGRWTVSARTAGESSQPIGEPRSVALRLQQTAIVDFTAGPIATETVSVSAQAPLVDPDRTDSQLQVDGTQVEDLPISGRVVTDLALLDSGVAATPAGNFYGERGSVFVVNGQSGRANSFLVDGLDNNDQGSGTTLNASFSQLVIREFVVLTRQYAPEFGRASGGIMNIITERGGNEPSGALFVQGVAGNLNPPGDFVASLPEQDGDRDTSGRSQFGFRLGGPFQKDRATWFAAYEHQQANEIAPYTGVTRDGVAGGWMVAPGHDDNLFLRTDVNLGPRNFLMTRLSVDDRRTTGLNVGGDVTPEAGFSLDERDVQLAMALTTPVSARLMNEARLLVGRSAFDQSANSDRPGVERPSGTFGGNNLNRQNRDEDRIQILDNITWQARTHTFKVGVDLMRSRTRIDVAFNPNGNFLYDTDMPFEPGDCGDLLPQDIHDPNAPVPYPCPGDPNVDDDGDGLIDEPGWISSYPFVFQLIEGKPRATLDDTRLATFAQDSWQVTPGFLLNYGLRYDLSTYKLPASAVVDSTVPNGGAGTDKNNIAPRLGFTWTPGGRGSSGEERFVVRGGGGIFYDKIVLGFPALAAITSGTRIGLLFPQGFAYEITEEVVEQYGIGAIKQGLIFPENLILRFSTATELDTPYTAQYSLGVEHAVGEHGSWSAGVTRALGYHQVLLRDLNPVIDTDPFGIPIHSDPNVGSIAAITTEGRSWYTGLDLAWRWRGEHAWWTAAYTWSKAIDMAPDPLKGGISLPPDSDHMSEERARSDSDRRHNFVLSGAVPLGWLGLRASGVIHIASGIPFNVTTGRDENVDGLSNDRPPGVGRNSGARTDLDTINKLRVEEGLPEIDSLREPGFSQVDFRVTRPFAFKGEKGTAEVFVQVFNVLDRFNPGTLDGAVTSRRFGEPFNQAGPPRILEMGLKMAF